MITTLSRAAIVGNLTHWTAMSLLSLCCLCAGAFAQEEAEQETPIETGTTEANDPGFVSARDSSFGNFRNHVGFSLGFHEMYSSNTLPGDLGRESATISTIEPRAFMNAGRRQQRLHMEFGAGYRFYKGHSNLNDTEVNGDINYLYQATRNTSIRIANNISSRNEDIFSYSEYMPSQFSGYPVFSYTLLQNRQRIIQNDLEGTIEFRPGRKDTIAAFSRYQIYRDDRKVAENTSTDGIQAGFNYEHRLTSWASFNAAWSAYLNNVDTRYRNSKVYRLEFGGFHFKMGQNWSLNTWGGAEILDTKGYNRRIDATGRALLTHNSNTNSQYVSFQRAYIATNGIGQVLQSYVVRVGLGQKLTRWLQFSMSGSYFLGREALENSVLEKPSIFSLGKLRSYNVRASLEFSIVRNLIAMMDYRYQNQKNSFPNVAGVVKFDRYIGLLGLQYFWPRPER